MESLDIISLRNKRSSEKIIKTAISDVIEINIDALDKNTILYEELNIDDLDLIEIIMSLEAKLNIAFNDDEIENILTVGDIYKFVQQKINNVNEPKL